LAVELGRTDLDLMAWLRAYLEKRPSPVGSEGLTIMLILLLVIFLMLTQVKILLNNLNPATKKPSPYHRCRRDIYEHLF
jgi:hypothetical protein